MSGNPGPTQEHGGSVRSGFLGVTPRFMVDRDKYPPFQPIAATGALLKVRERGPDHIDRGKSWP